jgi:hypothetical protein
MAEKTILQCDLPECATPENDVKRVMITVDGKQYRIDMCADDRAGLLEDILKFASRVKETSAPRRRGIKVTDPADFR